MAAAGSPPAAEGVRRAANDDHRVAASRATCRSGVLALLQPLMLRHKESLHVIRGRTAPRLANAEVTGAF